MIKAVIFDLDDTICNTSDILDQALRNTFAENLAHFPGKTVEEMMLINQEAFKETFLNPNIPVSSSTILIWLRCFELLNIAPPIKVVLRLIEKIRAEVRTEIKLIEGAKEIFTFLLQQHMKIGILSNGAYMEQAEKLVILGIDGYIDYLVTPDICLANKPDAKAFTYMLDNLHVSSDEVLMIGDDMQTDIKGARNAGIKTIYFQHRTKRHGMERSYADYSITSLLEIKNLILTTYSPDS